MFVFPSSEKLNFVVLQEGHWENSKTSWEYLGCSFKQHDTSLSVTHVKISNRKAQLGFTTVVVPKSPFNPLLNSPYFNFSEVKD